MSKLICGCLKYIVVFVKARAEKSGLKLELKLSQYLRVICVNCGTKEYYGGGGEGEAMTHKLVLLIIAKKQSQIVSQL